MLNKKETTGLDELILFWKDYAVLIEVTYPELAALVKQTVIHLEVLRGLTEKWAIKTIKE